MSEKEVNRKINNAVKTITNKFPKPFFRRIYASLDICTCNDGGYWPDKPEEAKEFYDYMHSKAMSELVRASRVKRTHEALIGGQMELGI